MSLTFELPRQLHHPIANRPPYWREIAFVTGYNDRGGSYGVHGMEIHFRFHGPLGVTQFSMGTGWVPGEVGRSYRSGGDHPSWGRVADTYPVAIDLGFHWRQPMPWMLGAEGYADDHKRTDCSFVPDGVCFYDGSGLNAEPILEAFIDRGEAAVWRALVGYYRELRGEVAT